jgi:hypothetical protein
MSDQIRMSRLLETGKACNASVALARARQLYGSQSYCPAPIPATVVPLVSQRLGATLANALCAPVLRNQPGTEGSRIATLQDCSRYQTSSADPATRFSEYIRFFPTPCPVIGAAYLNASMPKASTACQLPNSLLNPVLPA